VAQPFLAVLLERKWRPGLLPDRCYLFADRRLTDYWLL